MSATERIINTEVIPEENTVIKEQTNDQVIDNTYPEKPITVEGKELDPEQQTAEIQDLQEQIKKIQDEQIKPLQERLDALNPNWLKNFFGLKGGKKSHKKYKKGGKKSKKNRKSKKGGKKSVKRR